MTNIDPSFGRADEHFVSTINDLANACHSNSREKGFYNDFIYGWDNFNKHRKIEQIASRIALIHSEASEALECIRQSDFGSVSLITISETGKPEGLASELADVVIRVFDLATALDIDIGSAIILKMRYNSKRPHLHGGKNI